MKTTWKKLNVIVTIILALTVCLVIVNALTLPVLADSASCSSGACHCSCTGTYCSCDSGGGECSCACGDKLIQTCYKL